METKLLKQYRRNPKKFREVLDDSNLRFTIENATDIDRKDFVDYIYHKTSPKHNYPLIGALTAGSIGWGAIMGTAILGVDLPANIAPLAVFSPVFGAVGGSVYNNIKVLSYSSLSNRIFKANQSALRNAAIGIEAQVKT